MSTHTPAAVAALSTQAATRITRASGTSLALRAMFEAPTVARLAELLPAEKPAVSASRTPVIARRARAAGAQDRLRAAVAAADLEGGEK